MIGTAVLLLALASACARPAPAPAPPASLDSAVPAPTIPTQTPAALPAARHDSDVAPAAEPAETQPPITLKPATKPKPAATKASAASSLGGHDRHLVLKPLEPILAADFELGALASGRSDPSLWSALLALEARLVSAKLPYERFSDKAATLARIIYPEDVMQGITTVRFAAPRIQTGGVTSVAIRVIARQDGTPTDKTDRSSGEEPSIEQPARSSATGLVILAQGEADTWRVEHFELDIAALTQPMDRPKRWDPYSTPLQP